MLTFDLMEVIVICRTVVLTMVFVYCSVTALVNKLKHNYKREEPPQKGKRILYLATIIVITISVVCLLVCCHLVTNESMPSNIRIKLMRSQCAGSP